MRIAYLTGQYPRTTDTFIQREVQALRDLDVEIHTLAIRRPPPGEQVPPGFPELPQTCYVLPVGPLRLIGAHLALLVASPRRYFGSLALAVATAAPGFRGLLFQCFYFLEAVVVGRYLRRHRIDHLHNHFADSSCTVAMLAAEMSEVGFSFTLHGPSIFFQPMTWRLDEKIKRARFVSCISYFCRSQGMIFASPDTWNRMHVVHCGVDPPAYQMVKHEGRGRGILYVGRLVAVKGLAVLLDALAGIRDEFDDFELTVVGDGPDRVTLEAHARRLNLPVRFVGYRSVDQVKAHLEQSDLFVMSSFAEGVPVVLMEAMAAGLPVVATRLAGVAELVEDGRSGLLVNPSDPAALGRAVGRLLADPKLRSRFGGAGRAKVEAEFNIRKEAAWLKRLVAASLDGRIEPPRPINSNNQPVLGSTQMSKKPEESEASSPVAAEGLE